MVKAFAAGDERLSKSPRCFHTPGRLYFTPLLFVHDHLGRRFAHFKLRAHFLDLRGLLVEARSQLRRENLHPFLLLRDR